MNDPDVRTMTPYSDGLEAPRLLEPEPRPVKDDLLCDCGHPFWMHADGRPQKFCHFTGYNGDPANRCRCRGFTRKDRV